MWLAVLLLAMPALAQGTVAAPPGAPGTAVAEKFVLSSPEVAEGGELPKDYTGDGASSTLPLQWSGAPPGTQRYALIMHHVAPDMTKWYWILYNIPAEVTQLPKNVQGVGTVGNNSITRKAEYAPPHSKGPGTKTYIYTVYALSAEVETGVRPEEVTRDILLKSMNGKVLGTAEFHVTYTRFPDREGGRQERPAGARGPGQGQAAPSTGSGWLVAGLAAAGVIGATAGISGWAAGSRRLAGRVAIGVLMVGHFAWLISCFAPAIGTPDASGYLVQARWVATEGRTWFARESPLQYVNHHWLSAATGDAGSIGTTYVSQYPPGLAMLCAPAYRLGGPTAALLVNPVLASLAILGVYLLCEAWVGAGWGVAAAAMVAVNPITNEHALASDSHTAVMVLLVWATYLLVLWARRPRAGLALVAGVLLGMIPTIRYPEGLFLLGAGLFVMMNLRRDAVWWQSAVAMVVGGTIPVGALLARNQMVFGAFWRTGYSLTNEQTAFAWEAFTRKALPYFEEILTDGTGWIGGLGVVAMVALCVRRPTRKEGVWMVATVVPVTLLYMAYTLPEASLRFLIPTLWVYVVAAVWGVSLLGRGNLRVVLAAAMAAGVAVWGIPRSAASMERVAAENGKLARATQAVEARVKTGGLVIANDLVAQQLDYVGQWKVVDESLLSGMERDRRQRRPERAPGGRDGARTESGGGPRAVAEQVRRQILARYNGRLGGPIGGLMLADLDAWRGTEKVYWVGDVELMRRLVPRADEVRVLGAVQGDPQLVVAEWTRATEAKGE